MREPPPGRTPFLVAVGAVDEALLNRLAAALECPCAKSRLDPVFAFHAGRCQYHSTELLERLPPGSIGVAAVDLYIPILEFVFGEAELGGGRSIFSTFRLRQEFYGLPADSALLLDRAVKEALHEWGHALGLRHCLRYDCVMSAAHSVEQIDLKEVRYCAACLRTVGVNERCLV